MAMTTIECTLCKKTVAVSKDQLVNSLDCPHCHQTLRILRKPSRRKTQSLHVGLAVPENIKGGVGRSRVTASDSRDWGAESNSKTSPQQLRYLEERRKKKKALTDPIENFKQDVFPSELSIPYRYPSHWTFELAVAINICLSIGVFLPYLALITSIAFSLLYPVYSGVLEFGSGVKDSFGQIAFFVILLAVGLSTLFFLSKPLFVKTIQPVRRRLKKSNGPLIYKLVQQIAFFTEWSRPRSSKFVTQQKLR